MPTLSEADSKQLLAAHGVAVVDDRLVPDADAAARAAAELGYPVVVKLCGEGIAHKSERNLVRLGLSDAEAVRAAAADLLDVATAADGEVALLIAPMVHGNRELIAGLADDPQFGMTVMIGVGGVLAEAVADVAFRLMPITRVDAEDMIDDLGTQRLLGPLRGEPDVDRGLLVDILMGLSGAAEANPAIRSADLNPLIVVDGRPVAVDALVELRQHGLDRVARQPPYQQATSIMTSRTHSPAHFRALFDPRGVIVAGASTHPGKFGFVALHNILAGGYAGKVFATNREAVPVLGVETVSDVDQLPAGEADLVFVCTPADANPELLRRCATRGVTAAFVTSAGYGEAGAAGQAQQDDLVALCNELGILLAGPNGQGVVSTPSSLCAQIVAPYPPRGSIGIASQSGNFVSSFENYARHYGVGVSRAISAGNAAATTVADYLEYFADDPETRVGLAYVEGIVDGRSFFDRVRRVAERMPLVVVKGGVSTGGARAAASHTGSLATDDRVFDGMCRQAGVVRADTIEEGYEAAATFATQPLPGGSNVAVVSTAGGWGVVTADALSRAPGLELLALPDDLRAALDAHLPPRWSRNNPVDLAGGETKDTVPIVLEIVAEHPDVDAVVLLGMGIQGNQGRMEADGPFFPDHGLDRIVAYHARQDRRFTETAAALTVRTGKPILTATELSTTDPTNPAVVGCREAGVLCYGSANRAVTALAHLRWYARWRQRRGR